MSTREMGGETSRRILSQMKLLGLGDKSMFSTPVVRFAYLFNSHSMYVLTVRFFGERHKGRLDVQFLNLIALLFVRVKC